MHGLCSQVWVLLVDTVEEVQQAFPDVRGNGAHHAKVIVHQAATIHSVRIQVPWMRLQIPSQSAESISVMMRADETMQVCLMQASDMCPDHTRRGKQSASTAGRL